MDTYIEAFPEQLECALAIGKTIQHNYQAQHIQNILVAGMGGSGIGANFVRNFSSTERPVPFSIQKGYGLPAFVSEKTLVVCSSYSGNTEETLDCFYEAIERKAMIFCISSGGTLLKEAEARNIPFVRLPDDSPAPRAYLGYSMVQQLCLLETLGFIDAARIAEVEKTIALLRTEQNDLKRRAQFIAGFLKNKYPIIYSTDRIEPVAIRLRQQINENAKVLCSHHSIPEMNHNELVGWRKQKGDFGVLLLRNRDDHPRNQARIEINKEIIEQHTDTLVELYSKGNSLIERALYLVHFGDWLSWFMAQNRQVDAMEVHVIDYLKKALAKV